MLPALRRHVGTCALPVLDMKAMDDRRMLSITLSILKLTLAVFLIRLGHVRYPYSDDEPSAELRQVNRVPD